MNAGNNYDREVDLKALLFDVLFKWRGILLLAIICAVSLGGFKAISTYHTQADATFRAEANEAYENNMKLYESNIEIGEKELDSLINDITSQQEYLDKSVLINIDPYNVSEARVDLFIKTDYQIFPDMVYQNADYTETIVQTYQSLIISNSVLEIIADSLNIDSRYLGELITVERNLSYDNKSESASSGNILTIKVLHNNKAAARTILDLVLSNMDDLQKRITTDICNHSITIINQETSSYIDLSLADIQKKAHVKLADLQSALNERQKSYKELTEPVGLSSPKVVSIKKGIKYGVFGGVLGGCAAIFFIVIGSLLSDKVVSVTELRKRFHMNFLAIVQMPSKNRLFSVIDKWLLKMENSYSMVTLDEGSKLVITSIQSEVEENDSILLTGTESSDLIEKLCQKLIECKSNYHFIYGSNILQSSETRENLITYKKVILIEQINVSQYAIIEEEMELIKSLGGEILGFVILQV